MPPGTLGAAYRLYFTHVLPRIGGWISGDAGAYAYLPASVARFARPAEFGGLMTEAGFARVAWQALTGGVAHLYIGERNG
jgi:demethylmenaquinone methyltransferase / 2-methoxy-6-polyprenyl-1,4-benzoquinol methylase